MAQLAEKEERQTQYKKAFEKAKIAVITDYRGLSVAQLTQLRSDLFKQEAQFTVVKNTLIKRALKGTDGESLTDLFEGPNAVLLGFEDEIGPARTLKQFLKQAKIGEIKAGLLDGKILSKEEINELADLPPLEELRGKLLGAINSPLAGFVMSLASPQRALVNVLDQLAKQKEQQESS